MTMQPMQPLRIFLVMTALMGTVGAVHAQVFRCTDASGKLAFSDKQCDGSKAETVDLRFRGIAAPPQPAVAASAQAAAVPPPSPIPPPAEQAVRPPPPKAPEVPLADRLADLCVDVYRKHLAYPQGVRITGRTLEKSLSEYLITVYVKTISNPATPARIDPIIIDEKFICVTDGGSGLNARSTDMYVKRHRDGQRL